MILKSNEYINKTEISIISLIIMVENVLDTYNSMIK